jgi:hypothetical protein
MTTEEQQEVDRLESADAARINAAHDAQVRKVKSLADAMAAQNALTDPRAA